MTATAVIVASSISSQNDESRRHWPELIARSNAIRARRHPSAVLGEVLTPEAPCARKQIKRQAHSCPGRNRPVEPPRPFADSGALRPAATPATNRLLAKPGADPLRRPGDPPTPSLFPDGSESAPNQDYEMFAAKSLNHRGKKRRRHGVGVTLVLAAMMARLTRYGVNALPGRQLRRGDICLNLLVFGARAQRRRRMGSLTEAAMKRLPIEGLSAGAAIHRPWAHGASGCFAWRAKTAYRATGTRSAQPVPRMSLIGVHIRSAQGRFAFLSAIRQHCM